MSGYYEKQALLKWLLEIKKLKSNNELKLADVGCYDINGSVRKQLNEYKHIHVTGFDINVNHSDDIELPIPKDFYGNFDLITCIGTINYGDNKN